MKDAVTQVGAAILRGKAALVPQKDINSLKIKSIVARMKKILAKEEYGVAIAAPQLGAPLRIFVIAGKMFGNPTSQNASRGKDRVFINPELVRASKKKNLMSEGCLSVRGVYGTVKRSEKASVRARDEKGRNFTLHCSGVIAQIFQHELDHLEGVLLIDKAEEMTKEV